MTDMPNPLKQVVSAVQSALRETHKTTPEPDAPPSVVPDNTESIPASTAQPSPTPELNPRNRAYAEVAERAKATREAEAQERIEPGDEDRERAAAEEQQDVQQVAGDAELAPEPQIPTQGDAAQPTPQAFDPEAEYDLMVDGRPVKVKGSQIIDSGRRTIQKETAADYKLELASRLLSEAQARAAVPQPPAPGVAAPQPDPGIQAPSDADLAQVIQFGTTEQAAQAIAEIRRRAGPSLTPEGVQAIISKALPGVVNDQLAFHEAVRYVQSEYDDILKDPYLKSLFFMEDQRRMKAEPGKTYKERYQAIGEDLRKHFNRPKIGTPATPAPTMEQRQQAKAAAPAAPKLASVRLAGGTDQPKPKSREEIIAGMQAARGKNTL